MRTIVFLIVLLMVPLYVPQDANAQRADFLADNLKKFVTIDSIIVAVENVRIIDGTGVPVALGQTIIVRDGRLDKVGVDVTIPTEAEVIDGTGVTAIPGLVMMHEHLYYGTKFGRLEKNYPLIYLAHGVTTARTAGSFAPLSDLQMRSLIESGQWIGPDLDVSGPYLHGPHWFKSIFPITAQHEYETVEDVRQAAQYWAGRGVTSFKAFLGLSPEQLRAVVAVAREHDLKVAAHLCITTASEAAEIGIDSLEHGLEFATELHPDKKPGSCPSFPDLVANVADVDIEGPEVKSLIDDLVVNNVAVTPTFAAIAYVACHDGVPRAMAKRLLSDQAWPNWFGNACPSSELLGLSQEVRSREFANAMAFARKFADAGGLLLAGSDGLAGADSLYEVELFVEAGFTPVEAIKIATHNGATYLERLDEIGTLEEGKRADLVLVRGRPDQRISDIRNIEIVFKNGIGFDYAELLESVSGTIGD